MSLFIKYELDKHGRKKKAWSNILFSLSLTFHKAKKISGTKNNRVTDIALTNRHEKIKLGSKNRKGSFRHGIDFRCFMLEIGLFVKFVKSAEF